MPSLNRPNAPNRLPSADFGDLFYKPRAIRASEARSSATTPSPLSTPVNVIAHRRAFRSSEGGKSHSSSPLASPAVGISQRRPRAQERSIYLSESSTRSGASRESSAHSPNSPEVIEEEPTPLIHRTLSASSSLSSRTREILGLPDPRDSLAPRGEVALQGENGLGEARASSKWTRDFLGGRLEIRIGRQQQADEEKREDQPKTDLDETIPRSGMVTTLHLPISHASTIKGSTGDASGHPLLPETPENFDDSISTLGPLKEGLYCRTKRALGLKHGPITPYAPRSRTPTSNVLDRVTSTLRYLPRTSSVATSAATSVTNLSIAAPRRRHLRPARRSMWSASSSVRDLMMGVPPAATPEPEAMYEDAGSNKYLSVDLTRPNAPAFLPSEARRINTPPLPSEGSGKSHVRGFFFDYRRPSDDHESFPMRDSSPAYNGEVVDRSRHDDWYMRKLDAIDTSSINTSPEESDHNIPEHLPNSPLCPRNPKHKSGGTGTCPYHGRNKSTPSDTEQTNSLGRKSMLSPVPESWWLN